MQLLGDEVDIRKDTMKKDKSTTSKLLLLILSCCLGTLIWMNHTEHLAQTDEVSGTSIPSAQHDASQITSNMEDNKDSTAEGTTVLKLAVAGDILPHSGLNTEAKTGESYDYTAIMKEAATVFGEADFSIASLVTTFSGGPEYSGYPVFRTPDALAGDLKQIGIDLVATATAHSMDSHKAGVIRTLDVLDDAKIAHVGTYRSREERNDKQGITVIEKNDISIAFLSYTFGTGEEVPEGSEYMVNIFQEKHTEGKADEINYDLLKKDLKAAKALNVDLIGVFMYWGEEFQTSPISHQYELSEFLFKEGVDMIFGNHPQVPEPIELRKMDADKPSERKGFLSYSLGNFISTENEPLTHLTAVANIEIVKDHATGKTVIRDINYVPFFMVDLEDYGIEPIDWRYQLWNLHDALNAYDTGDDRGVITPVLANAMKQGVEDIHSIMGRDYDKYHRYENQ